MRIPLAIQRGPLKRSHDLSIRNRRCDEPLKISPTEAKNRFGDLLDRVLQVGMVVITRHETPKEGLLSMDEYGALSHAAETSRNTLNAEFDALLARMQGAK